MHLAAELLGVGRAELAEVSPAAPGAAEPVTVAETARRGAARDFWLEGFRDYLALESGHSANTVEAYLRDLRRLARVRGVARACASPAR